MRPTRTQSVSGRPLLRPPRAVAPGFGADAAELLAMDGAVSADVTAFVANDAARLPGPAGSAIVVDDFHIAAAAVVWVSAAVSGGVLVPVVVAGATLVLCGACALVWRAGWALHPGMSPGAYRSTRLGGGVG